MLKYVIDLLRRYQQFIMYSCIGVIGAGTDIIVFGLLHEGFAVNIESTNYLVNLAQEGLHLSYAIANMYSVTLGVIVTFVFNTLFNFKVTDHIIKRFGIYSIVGVVGLLLQWFVLFLFSDLLDFDATIVKIAFLPVVAVTQYTLNKTFSFSERLVQPIKE